MSWIKRLGNTLRPRRLSREIDDELRLHRELRQRDLARQLPEPDARRAAEARFGIAERHRERTRDIDIITWLESGLQDLRHAGRMLRRSPGFTFIVVLSLALGLGANAAIFGMVNEVLLRTLPVPKPQQIFMLTISDGVNAPGLLFSYPVLQQMQQAAASRAVLGGANSVEPFPVTDLANESGTAVRVPTQLVSGGYFPALGLAPARGRWISDNDNRASGASPVAVLSYSFWMQHFGGDPNIIGRSLTLRGVRLEVVGVAPAGFSGLDPSEPVDLWTPLMMQMPLHAGGNAWDHDGKDDQPWPPQEQIMWLTVFARVSQPEQAAALAAALSPPVKASFERIQDGRLAHRVVLTPGGQGADTLRKSYGAPLRALMAMVAIMLLIAVANVATLLLARMVRRRREIAIRLALGVSRGRLARQLLTEGLLLAAIAGVAAVGTAVGLSRLLIWLASGHGGAPFHPDWDWRVWSFLAAVTLGSGLLLGLLPAWQARRGDPATALKNEVAPIAGRIPLGRWLVIAQVAFTLLLVVGAGLFSRSLAAMFRIDLGFDRDHILTVQMALPDAGVPPAELAVLDQKLLDRVAALPGVRAAALDQSGIDAYSSDISGISLAGRVDPPGGQSSNENTVSRNYFPAVGMTLLRGRDFSPTDTATTPGVVVVNQAFARRFYPGQDPLGKTFGYDPESNGQFRIIGIVADARTQDPHQLAVPMFYRLLEQSNNPAKSLEVRTAGNPLALTAAVRAAVAATDGRLTAHGTSSLGHRLDEMLFRDRLVAQLSAGFGALALALACLGLYGVMAYAVAARGREFGIRIALGVEPGRILGLVLREAAMLVAGGLALGLPLALWASHALQPLLPGIGEHDPATFATAVAVTIALPLAATLRPAWRAMRTDPARALRGD